MLKEFEKYLWDSKVRTLDLQENRYYIIAKVLEYGNLEDAKKILHLYSKEDIINTIVTSTEISPRTAYFFKNYFKISKPIKCLTMQSAKQQRKLWPY